MKERRLTVVTLKKLIDQGCIASPIFKRQTITIESLRIYRRLSQLDDAEIHIRV